MRQCQGVASIHELDIVELTDDIHLAIIVLSVARSYLQLVGVGVVDSERAILDHINYVAAGDLLKASHVTIIWRDHDATIARVEDRQTAANLAARDSDIGAAVRADIELTVLAYLHAIVIPIRDNG